MLCLLTDHIWEARALVLAGSWSQMAEAGFACRT